MLLLPFVQSASLSFPFYLLLTYGLVFPLCFVLLLGYFANFRRACSCRSALAFTLVPPFSLCGCHPPVYGCCYPPVMADDSYVLFLLHAYFSKFPLLVFLVSFFNLFSGSLLFPFYDLLWCAARFLFLISFPSCWLLDGCVSAVLLFSRNLEILVQISPQYSDRSFLRWCVQTL